jgi:hypothetical protein
MDTAWTSSNPGLLDVAVDTAVMTGESVGSNRMRAAAATNETASVLLAPPLDLSGADELRFWIRSSRAADGTNARPFYLEFAYTDANDAVTDVHRWFVPVSRQGVWEQRRIGIENDRRSQVDSLEFRCLDDLSFACHVDELLAVREEVIADVERELAERLATLEIAVATDVPVAVATSSPATAVTVQLNLAFATGNRIVIRGGSSGDQEHSVASVTHNPGLGRTTLDFTAGETIVGNVPTTATVSLLVPSFFQAPPTSTATSVTPTVVATHLDAREDSERTPYYLQRDSFRLRNGRTVCSARPAARAYALDYQLTVVAPNREQQRVIHEQLLGRFSADVALRVNGSPYPVWILPPPPLDSRGPGELAPVYLRVGTRQEVSPRVEQTWVRRLEIESAHADARTDTEELVVDL